MGVPVHTGKKKKKWMNSSVSEFSDFCCRLYICKRFILVGVIMDPGEKREEGNSAITANPSSMFVGRWEETR